MAALKISNENILGVYIKCHGEFTPKFTIVNSPSKLTITKKNLGGYGCASYDIPRVSKSGMPIEYETALSLTKGMSVCYSQEQYSRYRHVDKYGDEIDKSTSCEEFTSRQWAVKIYTLTKGKIVFALNGRIFDLMSGFSNFIQFLIDVGGPLPQDSQSQTHKILQELERNFPHSKMPIIRTETIFHMMRVIQLHTEITNANILDESCNVSIDKSQPPVERIDSKTGQTVRIPVLVPRDRMPILPPGTGYGGTKKHKKYKRKTHYRVKNKYNFTK